MDHEAAAPLVAELAAGRPAGAREAEVRAHVLGCEECRQVLATAEMLRAQIVEHGAALFSAHPDADTLAAYSVAAAELASDRLAAIGLHVRACPTCAAEVAAARAANRESGLHAWMAALEPRLSRPWVAPALAAGLVALLVPAYLGLVELPRARRAALAAPAAGPAFAPAPQAPALEGSVAAVLLTSGTRGAGELAPTVTVAPGSPALALLVAAEPAELPATGAISALLLDERGIVAWRSTFDAASAWDPARRVVTLLVPRAGLSPGGWTLRLTAPGAVRPSFEGRFRIAMAAPGKSP